MRWLHLRHRRKEHGGIEVALNRRTVADVHPGLVDVDAPVDADHVAASRMEFAEEAELCRCRSESRARRGADAFNQRARVLRT
jgi:hypothetical protein